MDNGERDELLIRLDTKLDTALERLNDHGSRLRALEMFRNWATGAGAVAALVVGAMKLNLTVGQK